MLSLQCLLLTVLCYRVSMNHARRLGSLLLMLTQGVLAWQSYSSSSSSLSFSSSSSSSSRVIKAHLTGAGISLSSPLTAFQMTSLNSRSGAASMTARLNASDFFEILDTFTFISRRLYSAGSALNGFSSGVDVKHSHIGVAAASY